MNVYSSNFWYLLPDIIQEIADADYVAIDLEMTGIWPRKTARLQRPTQDTIYQQSREAAQIFQILQFGITCLRYKGVHDTYTATSYNFHVSPMFQNDSSSAALARLVDRTLVVSYSSLLFLRSSGNRLEDSYVDGIPYLSREDEDNVANAFLGLDKDPTRNEIDLETQDDETKAFYNEARASISHWEQDPNKKEYLNISNPHGGRVNRFQQRLVHQLLQKEFPGKYRGHCKFNLFMQVSMEDDPIEEKLREEKTQNRQKCLKSHKGLRYILEALAGGNFAEDTAGLVEPDNQDAEDRRKLWSKLVRCEQKLKTKQPVLVGHNMLLDLCFTYEAFFGTLPESLEEFSHNIHQLFPRIVDTKHLATQDGHDMMSANNLEELYAETKTLLLPVIAAPRTRRRENKAHHAGYDSSMTATLFAKKAWQMITTEEGGRPAKLPDWDSPFFQAHGNRLRVGNAGILELMAYLSKNLGK